MSSNAASLSSTLYLLSFLLTEQLRFSLLDWNGLAGANGLLAFGKKLRQVQHTKSLLISCCVDEHNVRLALTGHYHGSPGPMHLIDQGARIAFQLVDRLEVLGQAVHSVLRLACLASDY